MENSRKLHMTGWNLGRTSYGMLVARYLWKLKKEKRKRKKKNRSKWKANEGHGARPYLLPCSEVMICLCTVFVSVCRCLFWRAQCSSCEGFLSRVVTGSCPRNRSFKWFVCGFFQWLKQMHCIHVVTSGLLVCLKGYAREALITTLYVGLSLCLRHIQGSVILEQAKMKWRLAFTSFCSLNEVIINISFVRYVSSVLVKIMTEFS